MIKNTIVSAFPYRDEQGDGSYIQHFGLSKREWYAGLAMQGLVGTDRDEYVVEQAFRIADAMIAEGSQQ